MTNLPKIALGVWAWGNDGTFGTGYTEEQLRPIFDAAMEHGLNLWDTAYAYGMGTSEKMLGAFLKGRARGSYLISDKLTPQCMDYSSDTPVEDMWETQLKLLRVENMDIYWVHNPVDAPRWITAAAEFFEGKADAPMIGVSNHDIDEIKEADRILREHGLKLGAVQNHYSLLNRSSEESGILDYCRANDVHFFSYMVLEQGALSGQYDTHHPMPDNSARAAVYNPIMDKIETFNLSLKLLADKYGVGIAQIPVAWAIGKGTLPIIGVTKERHVADAVRATEITLTAEEIHLLESTADKLDFSIIREWEKEMK
ncbi:oxidoreductase, aldo/keto reductase family protein [Selenomonas sp. FOBRC6]|uniref:aldo/keto reductase n=1 Tax=Selenomonas sp. FOBRC6 TaxID=936572 RepID=UPI000277EF7B|nr:aldo/keto reductase [Selenomonas sp. FOBRC6]EJO23608.1 oxidoreductase, aldo/keto reductase family protein [Selenomonas sp. FOBRC6]